MYEATTSRWFSCIASHSLYFFILLFFFWRKHLPFCRWAWSMQSFLCHPCSMLVCIKRGSLTASWCFGGFFLLLLLFFFTTPSVLCKCNIHHATASSQFLFLPAQCLTASTWKQFDCTAWLCLRGLSSSSSSSCNSTNYYYLLWCLVLKGRFFYMILVIAGLFCSLLVFLFQIHQFSWLTLKSVVCHCLSSEEVKARCSDSVTAMYWRKTLILS